jgi:hypothetical protein
MSTIEGGNGKKFSLRILIWLVLFAAGLGAWIILLVTGRDPARAWRALLINFIFFTPLASGLITWSAIVLASNGRWAEKSERLAWTGVGFLIPSFLIFIGLWVGSPKWAPWYNVQVPQGIWLNNTYLFMRDFAGLLVLWGAAIWYLLLRREGRQHAIKLAAVLILVYCLVFTLIAFDLIMALDPRWHSAIFGGYFFISSLYSAVALWAFLVVFQPHYGENIRHDLGKLIVTFSVLSVYFLFIQLLTIWYENLPKETSYAVHRMNYFEWNIVSGIIVGIVYLSPLVLLLTSRAKKSRFFLGGVGFLLLVGLWFDRWWMVAPQFSPVIQLGWAELAATLATLGIFGLSIDLSGRVLPDVPRRR